MLFTAIEQKDAVKHGTHVTAMTNEGPSTDAKTSGSKSTLAAGQSALTEGRTLSAGRKNTIRWQNTTTTITTTTIVIG